MSYKGYNEQLCANGHYSAQDCYADRPAVCVHCAAPIAYSHGVDQTNGYSRRYSYSCEAKKAEIGFDDVWHEDHYGTRYATKLIQYEPRGKAWRRVARDSGSRSKSRDAQRLDGEADDSAGPKGIAQNRDAHPSPDVTNEGEGE